MPHRPVVAKMPNGELRLVWADPATKLAIEVADEVEYYQVEVESEEEFERLRRKLVETKQRGMQEN